MLSDMFDSRHMLLIGGTKEECLKLEVDLDLSWNSL